MEPWGLQLQPSWIEAPAGESIPGAVSKVSGPYHSFGAGRFRIYNIRKLADKLNSTMVDAIHQVVAERLRELHVEP